MNDLDRMLDYRIEYSRFIHDLPTGRDRVLVSSPFRADAHPSFSIDLERGLWKDFASGEGGNYVTFRAMTDGLTTREAYRRICGEHGI